MAPAQADAAHAMSERGKVQRLLDAARAGDLDGFKGAARVLDGGDGLRDAVEEVKDGNERGSLHFAALEGGTDVCKYILEELKLPVDPRDKDGDTPLIHAARLGHTSTALYLLSRGADPLAASNELSANALHHAAATGSLELVAALLDKGVSVEASSDAGPPLIWAAGSGKAEAVKLLLERGANPNSASEDDVTPLFSATAAGATGCVKILLDKGADANVKAGGATPLHVAADTGDEVMVSYLLKAGADPNALDDDKAKPIHIAAARGHRAVVEQLLDVTSPGTTAEDWTVDGIISRAQAEGAAVEAEIEKKKVKEAEPVSPERVAKVLEAKARGTDAFKQKNFLAACDAYTQAIDLDPSNAELYSNRSLCWMRLGQADHALSDARIARRLRPTWSKACYREGAALRLLQRFDEAAEAFYEAVVLDPENKELIAALQEAVDAGKKFHQTAAQS